jgi:hypothetical protein
MDFMLQKISSSIVSELQLTFDVMLEEKQMARTREEFGKSEKKTQNKKRREAM